MGAIILCNASTFVECTPSPFGTSYGPNMIIDHGRTYTCHNASTIHIAIAIQILPANASHAHVGCYKR